MRLLGVGLLVFAGMVTPPAHGGETFVNGLPVQGLKNLALEGATVRFDAAGDLHVYAPQHQVEAIEGVAKQERSPRGKGVDYGNWWLVGEDTRSQGHKAEIWISGIRVAEIRSGGDPVMIDLGPYLGVGDNVITLRGGSDVTASGTLAIYVGEASVEAGTLNLNQPSISIFCRTSCPALQQETLRVN